MIILREHQDDFIASIRNAFKTHKAVLAQAPVGFGKTIISAFMANRVIEKNGSMYFCVHTKDLITQTYKAFSKFNIQYGFIAADYYSNKNPIQICSINTLKNRLTKYPAPTLVVIDECHFCGAAGWAKMVAYYKSKGCYILGLSASPWRMSNEGLEDHFDVMVHGKSTRWLIDNKYLSQYKLYVPSEPNLSKTHVRMGDYVQSEIEKIMDKPTITGCAITHWRKYADGKRTIAFCISIEHSKHTAAQFNASGVPAAHLDGECTREERQKVINDFADGKIKVITNCYLFSAGFDLSLQVDRDITVEAVILLRPSQSLSLFIQMTGRALRYKDYPAIILDHAGMTHQHGFPCQDREWTLKGRDKSKSKSASSVSVRICSKCFMAVQSFMKSCPGCGFVFEIKSREVEHVDGELREVNPNEVVHKYDRINENWQAKTFNELVEIGKRRGYKSPYAWAKFTFNARQAKKLQGVK